MRPLEVKMMNFGFAIGISRQLSTLKRGAAIVVFSALAAGTLVLAGTGSASAATLGTASSRGFDCRVMAGAGRQVAAYPPQMTSLSGNLEKVEWYAELYRWNGSSWVLYSTNPSQYYWTGSAWVKYTAPQMDYAIANGNGTVYQQLLYTTWFAPNGNPVVMFAAFNNLPNGYYAVVDHYRWTNGGVASLNSPFLGGGSWCLFP